MFRKLNDFSYNSVNRLVDTVHGRMREMATARRTEHKPRRKASRPNASKTRLARTLEIGDVESEVGNHRQSRQIIQSFANEAFNNTLSSSQSRFDPEPLSIGVTPHSQKLWSRAIEFKGTVSISCRLEFSVFAQRQPHTPL